MRMAARPQAVTRSPTARLYPVSSHDGHSKVAHGGPVRPATRPSSTGHGSDESPGGRTEDCSQARVPSEPATAARRRAGTAARARGAG